MTWVEGGVGGGHNSTNLRITWVNYDLKERPYVWGILIGKHEKKNPQLFPFQAVQIPSALHSFTSFFSQQKKKDKPTASILATSKSSSYTKIW